MGKKYKAAVIGCGRIGVTMEEDPRRVLPATHAGAYSRCDQTDLAAFVEPMEENLKKACTLFPKAKGFKTCAEMLKEIQPDIVSIATPPFNHRELVEQCAKSKVKAIVCEKPIAENSKDGSQMIETCQKEGALLFINHMRRYDPFLRDFKSQIESGEIGKVLTGTAYYTAGLYNTATHLVDLLQFFLGDVQSVRGEKDNRLSIPAQDVGINGWLKFKQGVPVALQYLEVKNYSIFDIHLYGEKGRLVMDRFGFSKEKTRVRECVEYSGYNELDVEHTSREGKSRSFMVGMAEHVVACLNGKEKPLSRGEDGLAALQVLLALEESAKKGGIEIDLDEWRKKNG